MTAIYSDAILAKYIDLIKTNGSGEIKAFFQGDPVKIPNSMLPCVIVSKSQSQFAQINNVQDEHRIGIIITVVTDIRSQLTTEQNTENIAAGISKLYELVEGRGENYSLLTKSIIQVLRSNQLVDSSLNLRTNLSSPLQADYGSTLRQRQPELWSTEARIEITAQFIQQRS